MLLLLKKTPRLTLYNSNNIYVFMTSNSFSLVVKVLLNTLLQGQHNSCVEKTYTENTASAFCPFQDYFYYVIFSFCASILHLEKKPQTWGW